MESILWRMFLERVSWVYKPENGVYVAMYRLIVYSAVLTSAVDDVYSLRNQNHFVL